MKALFVLSQQLNYAGSALLQQALTSAGWAAHEYETVQAEGGVDSRLSSGRFGCVVGFGDAAMAACLGGDWRQGYAADRRGYIWEGVAGCKVLSTLDPQHCVLRMDPSGINGMLLVADLEQAKRELKRGPRRANISRQIVVVGTASDAARSADRIRASGYSACDIECSDPSTLLCIGFAISPTEAYVFVGEALDAALEIVADPAVHKVFQNGQFDAYFLATRCGTRVAGWTDDCMIAWHALWPEIAGKGARGSKRTRKSLAFLASLYTESPEWWKCLKADTPVLTASFAWKPLKDIQVGEHVWGFDEFNEPGEKRRWRLAEVLGKNASVKSCIKIKTEHGSLVCTPDHKLLVKTKSGDWRWMQAQEARVGETLRFVSKPVKCYDDYSSGWMGGFADGEGSVRWDRNSNSGGAISLAQNAGPVLQRVKHILQEDMFGFSEYEKQPGMHCLTITGGRSAWIRFLAAYQPLRLCHNTGTFLEGSVFSTTPSRITAIEPHGEEDVVDIATSTGTFIAGGYGVHNCYDTDEAGMYELNGQDCCITYEIMQNLRREIAEQGVQAIYAHEMSMMPVLVAIQERGLAVDEDARVAAMETLTQRAAAIESSIRQLAEPLLRERSAAITKPHLFFGKKRCSCCNGGKSKAMACWSCAGLAGPARKRDNVSLGPCSACGGVGSFETFDFNPASTQQQVELFYNVLGLPKRYNDGSLTADEKALKSLLAELA